MLRTLTKKQVNYRLIKHAVFGSNGNDQEQRNNFSNIKFMKTGLFLTSLLAYKWAKVKSHWDSAQPEAPIDSDKASIYSQIISRTGLAPTLTEEDKLKLAKVREALKDMRKVPILKTSTLKLGMTKQIAVSHKPENVLLQGIKSYREKDKLLVHNYQGEYFVTGSFCTYDGSDLKNGTLFGKKITCAKWGSAYSVDSGTVENGPALRNLSAFPISIDHRTDILSVFIPQGEIPMYGKSKILNPDPNSNEKFVILGDTLTTLGAVTALRSNFTGKILIVPNGDIATEGFINTKVLREQFKPLKTTDQYIVPPDFLAKNHCSVLPNVTVDEIMQIDSINRKIVFANGLVLPYTKCLLAYGSEKHCPFVNEFYKNVVTLKTVKDHAKIFNMAKSAKHIVIYGHSFEAYELAASLQGALDELASQGGNQAQIYLIEPPTSEILRSFGENVHKTLKSLMLINGIKVLSDFQITNEYSQDGEKLDGILMTKNKENTSLKLRTDLVILETNLEKAHLPLNQVLIEDFDKQQATISPDGVVCVDFMNSIETKNLYSTLFAAGSWAVTTSSYKDGNYRQQDPFWEVDSGFYAGLSMMNKRIGRL